jgi:glutathione S-transferase
MPFSYIGLDEAISRTGLRMVVVSNIPSPWGEAAKGLFHIKGIEWAAVRLTYDSEPLKDWAGGQRSGPVVIYEKEKPRAGWAEILLLAERLAPTPALLPTGAAERAVAFGLCHELCGEMGLGWSRRLQLIHAGLNGGDGFPPRVAQYLGKKYGYTPELGAAATVRVADLLRMLATRLKAQHAQGSRFYLGNALTAVDVYAATFMAMFRPLPEAQCAMDPTTRKVFESQDPMIEAALDPILLEHRDMLYAEHLELPLCL